MIGEALQAIRSSLDWWADAGLIDAVSDQPCNWLAQTDRAIPLASVAIARPAAVAVAEPTAGQLPVSLPDTLPAFDAWLATTPDLPGADGSMRRLLPTGPVEPPLMLLADVPDPADIELQRPFAGKQGQLVDAMLRAIGLTREMCRIGSIAFTRPLGGRIDDRAAQPLAAFARHHVSLVRPRVLLLLGQQSAQLIAEQATPTLAKQQVFNHNGATVASFALYHPRLLLERPLLKRAAWETLKCVRELL